MDQWYLDIGGDVRNLWTCPWCRRKKDKVTKLQQHVNSKHTILRRRRTGEGPYLNANGAWNFSMVNAEQAREEQEAEASHEGQ